MPGPSPSPTPDPARSALAAPCLSEIGGQEGAKRAMEIAAGGGHHFLIVGPPGAGKRHLARAFPSILPPPRERTRRAIEERHTLAGLPVPPGVPSRWPGAGATRAALLGHRGWSRPGEIALAHGGALVLDQIHLLPVLTQAALAGPLAEGSVRTALPAGVCEMAADFVLFATAPPCPCGHDGSPRRGCGCTKAMRRRHDRAISPALRERIHLCVRAPGLELAELRAGPQETSLRVLERVTQARDRQLARNGGLLNARLPWRALDRYAALDATLEQLLTRAAERLGLSAGAALLTVRVARTIADLAGSDRLRVTHVTEALQYRPPQLTGP